MIAVDLVLLSYICTKMDYMLLTLAVRMLHSRALVHKGAVKLFDLRLCGEFRAKTITEKYSKKESIFTLHSALNKELFTPPCVILN